MNPTEDILTTELQRKTRIEPPVVAGEGQNTAETTTAEKLSTAAHTIVSGVEKGLEYTGEKLKETGDQIEKTIQKATDAVAEEQVELPGVVTLLQNGAARIFEHLTGTSASTTPSTEGAISAPLSPLQETLIYAEKNLAGDIITTDIQKGHIPHQPISRLDVMKESGQLGPELHLPNLKVRNVPLNRAVEEPSILDTTKPNSTQMTHEFPSFVYIHEQQTTPLLSAEHTASQGSSQGSSQASHHLEYKDESEQLLPNLTKHAVHDGAVFIKKVEKLDSPHHTQKSKHESEQFPKQLYPNLPTKVVHDGVAFLDEVEKLDSPHHTRKSKHEFEQLPKAQSPQLPNLSTKVVHDGIAFIDEVEKLDSPQQHTRKSKHVTEFEQSNLLPNLSTKTVHDGVAFIDEVEKLDSPQQHTRKSKHVKEFEQFPNLSTKVVHDGVAFIDKVGKLDTRQHTQKPRDVMRESVQLLPNLTAKVVHDGVAFIDKIEHDVVENSGQSL